MKRTATWMAAVLLSVGLAVAPTSPATGGTKACAKIRHSKIVWVKVKRGDSTRWVKRQKVWWTCDPYEAPGPPRLGVIAKEFRLTLTRPYVLAGELVLELNNQGGDVHNLRVAPVSGGPVIARIGDTSPRQKRTVVVPVKPGTYRMWCALPQHAKLGMKADLVVASATRP